jgi:hypothetical protein
MELSGYLVTSADYFPIQVLDSTKLPTHGVQTVKLSNLPQLFVVNLLHPEQYCPENISIQFRLKYENNLGHTKINVWEKALYI